MKMFSSLLVIFSLIFATTIAEDCKPSNKCECKFADGTGYNLAPVNEDLLEAITVQNLTFFYHPCGDVTTIPLLNLTVIDNECAKGYTLCMYNKTLNKLINLGVQKDMRFQMNGENMQVVFIGSPETSSLSAEIRSSVTLECSPKAKTSVLYAPLEKIELGQVNLSMYSKFSCPVQIDVITHHGFFYTLFIVLLTFLFVYLFMGMLINYFFIGARGYELIPNYDFWCKVWRSMKLGFIYLKNGCRVIPAEDSYDAI